MGRMLFLVVVLAFQAVLQVHGTGYLQVGFFLYEFRHDPTTLPADITGLPLPPFPPTPDPTSPPPVRDVIGDVSPWRVRTLLPNQDVRDRGLFEDDFRNGGGRDRDGGDTLWSGSSPCNETSSPRPQYRFLLCLDYVYSKAGDTQCRLGKVELSTLSHLGTLGRDLVTFPSALGVTSNGSVTSNPIVFGFDSWKGAVRLKVFVRCCGVAADHRAQCEESFSYTIHQTPASFSLSLSPQNVMLSGRGRLVLSLRLQCDQDFYGPQCQARCRVDAPEAEHAFCNVTSGEKQCLAGWEGDACQTDVDECGLNYCQNGAHCVNSPPGAFTCQCPLGFVGRRCQRRAPVCHTMPCKHGGTCHDTPFGFVCFCIYGYAGYRCERQLHINNLTVSDSLDVGKTTGSDDHYFTISWESWYSGLVIGGFFFIALIVVICCLLRGRLFRCGITANGSFYSLFISTKTNDSVLQTEQHRDSVPVSDSVMDMHTYQNIFSVTGKPPYPSNRRSLEEVTRKSGSDDMSMRYLSHLPSCRRSLQDMYLYANMGAPSTSDELEGLPNLVDPRKSPLLVHKDPEPCVAERKSCPNRRLSPLPIRWPLSDKTDIPKLMVTQHFQPPAAKCHFDTASTHSSNSPESVRGESRVKATNGRKSIIRTRARDVYTIDGSRSVEDLTGMDSPKPAPKKTLLGTLSGRKKASQPRLCSIRRMDSGGYEIPLKYQDTASLRNQYASLRHSKMDEHVYNELHCPTPGSGIMGRRKLGDNYFQQQASKGKQRKLPPFLTVDQRTSVFSETACYVDLTEHVPENDACRENPVQESSDVFTKQVMERSQEEPARGMSETSSELSSAGTKRKVQAEKCRIRTVQRCKKSRKQPSQRPLTQDCARKEVRWAGTDNPAFEHEERAMPALTPDDGEDSDDVDYEELFNADTDDDMYSDCDYTDVFTKTNTAV